MWANVLLWENKGCVGYSWGKVRACILSHFSRVQLCDPMDYSLPGSSAHGILQASTETKNNQIPCYIFERKFLIIEVQPLCLNSV